MATRTLGTTSTTALTALQIPKAGQSALAVADIASFNLGVYDDQLLINSYSSALQASQVTATWTNSTTALTALTNVAGPAIGSYMNGFFITGAGILPGTFITNINVSAGTATLSQVPAVAGTGAAAVLIPRGFNEPFVNGCVNVPNRGQLKTFPGDVIAFDPIAGSVFVLPRAAIDVAGSVWNLV